MTPIIFIQIDTHAHMGWVESAPDRHRLHQAIERTGRPLHTWQLTHAADLEAHLHSAPQGALYWPNAYQIPTHATDPTPQDLPALLESHHRPLIGSPAAALATMRDKRHTQATLTAARIPTPHRIDITPHTPTKAILTALQAIPAPWIIKPATTCGSVDIDLDARTHDPHHATHRAHALAHRHGAALIEEFLPGPDTTIALIGNPPHRHLIATHYLVTDRPPATAPLDREARLRPWGAGKTMTLADDPTLLDQLHRIIPTAADAIGTRDITRIDGRTDRHGRFRVFDVNGMPALAWPDGVLIRQLLTAHPDRAPDDVYDHLIAAIIQAAEQRLAP